MSGSVESALLQWGEGERRLRDLDDGDRTAHERAAGAVLGELRRRLGSSFTLEELAELYARDVDWATDVAWQRGAQAEAASVVDAAFGRYAHAALNYAGGRWRDPFQP